MYGRGIPHPEVCTEEGYPPCGVERGITHPEVLKEE